MNLSIKNLSKSFGKKTIFKDFSYEFSSTGICLISGDSGIGKTTLLRMISGLDKAFTGKISNGGISNVSFAFQEYRLFPNLNAVENVMTGVSIEDEDTLSRAKALLSELGFTDEDMKLFPSELSGGMKQRVSLARAFVKNAPILLLDEPTNELDEGLVKTVLSMIERESKKRLVIMVTHSKEDFDSLVASEIHI